jgi:hypothetical protein
MLLFAWRPSKQQQQEITQNTTLRDLMQLRKNAHIRSKHKGKNEGYKLEEKLGFSLKINKITTDPRRLPPSLPLLNIGIKI